MCRCLLTLSFHLLHHYRCSVGGDGASGGFRDLTETGIFAASPSHSNQLKVVLFQGFHVCGHGVVVLRGGSGCAGRWGIFEGENGSILFPEGGGRIETGALCRLFCCPGDNTVLLEKVLYGVGPVSISSFLPLLHYQVFEDIGLKYARNKLRDFVVVGDLDVVLLGIVLSPCKVSSVGADVLVGGVAPGGNGGRLCRHYFGVGYYGPHAEVSDEQQNGFHTVPKVVHLFFFDVLWHDGDENSGSPVKNDGFLEMVLVPCHLMLVGELLVFGDGCQGSDVGVHERRFFHPGAVERGVVGNAAHLGFLKDKG